MVNSVDFVVFRLLHKVPVHEAKPKAAGANMLLGNLKQRWESNHQPFDTKIHLITLELEKSSFSDAHHAAMCFYGQS